MTTYDLRKQTITLDELFRVAADEKVLVVAKDGTTFVIEPADSFEQEVAMFRQSEKFMTFLAERSKEQATISLDELEREIDDELAREAAAQIKKE
jgi:hypothetical protein